MAESEKKTNKERETLLIIMVIGLTFASVLSYQAGFSNGAKQVSEQAIVNADYLEKWITTGTNITIQHVSVDEYNSILHDYIMYDHIDVKTCWSAFDFTASPFLDGVYDSTTTLTIYRSGVAFLTGAINGTSYQIQFGRTAVTPVNSEVSD